MRLSINIGTRGRPQMLKPTIEGTLKNIVLPETRILVACDDDDKLTTDALGSLPQSEHVIYSVKPREDNRGAKSDRVLMEAPADIYAVGHDAVPIMTPGFDRMIVNAAKLFPDGIGVVATRMANASFPAMQAVTKRWVELVGYIYSHEYPFWFIDHELDDLARMTGRCVYVDVETANASHPGKTHRMHDLRFWLDYFDMALYRRRAMASKIIDALDEPQWRKAMLRTWFNPVEARSIWINQTVREHADEIEAERGSGGEPDEGYLLAFERARQQIIRMRQEIMWGAA